MKQGVVVKVLLCSFCFGSGLYSYLGQQNELTKLKIALPQVAYEVKILEEENTRLRYEVERFENPSHLMDLAKRSDFSHLRHPSLNEVYVTSDKADFSPEAVETLEKEQGHFLRPRVVIGAR